jgi:hypothetical protein
MFIVPPNNFNQAPMWNAYPMFSEPPMMPMTDFDMFDDDTRQTPKPVTPPVTPPMNQDFELPPVPPVVNNPLYTQGWMVAHIGKYIKIEFLIGTNMWMDREGVLKEVGISYFVIQESGTNDLVMCDIYSVKFVRIFSTQPAKCIP